MKSSSNANNQKGSRSSSRTVRFYLYYFYQTNLESEKAVEVTGEEEKQLKSQFFSSFKPKLPIINLMLKYSHTKTYPTIPSSSPYPPTFFPAKRAQDASNVCIFCFYSGSPGTRDFRREGIPESFPPPPRNPSYRNRNFHLGRLVGQYFEHLFGFLCTLSCLCTITSAVLQVGQYFWGTIEASGR